MSELDYHKELVGRVIAHLVKGGLRRIDIEPGDALSIMVETHGDEEKVVEEFSDVLRWMRDEQLIRVANIQAVGVGDIFLGVQLTAKALEAIKQPQESLGGSSVQAEITEKNGDLGSDIYHKIAEAVGGFVGGFTKSLGSG